MTNWYSVLEVSESASTEIIRQAWKFLQRRYHPDNKATGNLEKSKQVNLAHDVLSDPDRRAAFDQELARSRQGDHNPQSGWPAGDYNPDAYPLPYAIPMDLGQVAREVLLDASVEIGSAFLNNVMHQMSPFARKMFVDAIQRRREAQRQAAREKKKA